MRENEPEIDFAAEVEKAARRIRADIVRTPLEPSEALSRRVGARVYLKWESEQTTGSFKLRGALNKLRSLPPTRRARGVVSASTGNHGLGMSRAVALEGIGLSLILPENVSAEKMETLRRTGADLSFFGSSCEKAEIRAREIAADSGRIFVSPYNDVGVIFGQGTIGLEILEDLPETEVVFVPIGGGGLISGIGGYLKSRRPEIGVVGVEPIHSAFMKASLEAGRVVEIREKETLADAVAGGLEPGTVTLALCRRYVDDILTISEARLRESMKSIYETHGRAVEGAGALPLAGLFESPGLFAGRTVVLVISGKNISDSAFREIIR